MNFKTQLLPEDIELLKRMRFLAHVTQQQVADAVGCKKSNISMFERGKNPNVVLYYKILEYLEEVINEEREGSIKRKS